MVPERRTENPCKGLRVKLEPACTVSFYGQNSGAICQNNLAKTAEYLLDRLKGPFLVSGVITEMKISAIKNKNKNKNKNLRQLAMPAI